MKISLTRTLQIAFNILIVAFSLGTYSFVSRHIQAIFIANDRVMNQQKAEFIAKSIRPIAPSRDYVVMRMAFKNALNDPSVQMVRFVPDDASEGICVASNGDGCFSKNDDSLAAFKTELYFDSENKQPMGAVRVTFQNDGTAKINRAIRNYIGAALILIVLFFNFMIFFSFRSIRQQIEWSIEAVRRISRGEPVPLQKSVLMEKSQFSSALTDLKGVLEDYKKDIEQASKKAVLVEVARGVAHDIRDPLLALDSTLSLLGHLPESKRVITRKAITRIRDIATSLIEKSKAVSVGSHDALNPPLNKSHSSIELLSSLTEAIVAEKRVQFRPRKTVEIQSKIEAGSYGIFVDVNVSALQRVLSNLINNGVESIKGEGHVLITVDGNSHKAVIKVTDNGSGISESVKEQILLHGGTFYKKGGSGIGLRSAIQIVEACGGHLDIETAIGKGTTVSITLPRATTPDWFVPELRIERNNTICVLDDDETAHRIWDYRLKRAGIPTAAINVKHFYSVGEIMDWCYANAAAAKTAAFFCDYELLGQNLNGLEVIKLLKIERQSVLVTSRYDEAAIREECQLRGVRLLPKSMLEFVPIHWKAEVMHHAHTIS